MLLRVKVTTSFSKFFIEKKRTIQVHVKFSSILKNCVFCSSINWPSKLVNNNACILQVLTTLTQSQKKTKKTVTLNWVLGTLGTSEFPLFILFFVVFLLLLLFFFLSGFSFTDTDDSQDNRGRDRTIFQFTLPLPPAHEHSGIYFATLHVRSLWQISNRTACIYQAATRWDLPLYQITVWLIDDALLIFVSLLVDSIQSFCYSHLALETGWLKPSLTIILVLQANRLTNCANHPIMFLSCCFVVPQLSFGLLLMGQDQSSNVNHYCFIAI